MPSRLLILLACLAARARAHESCCAAAAAARAEPRFIPDPSETPPAVHEGEPRRIRDPSDVAPEGWDDEDDWFQLLRLIRQLVPNAPSFALAACLLLAAALGGFAAGRVSRPRADRAHGVPLLAPHGARPASAPPERGTYTPPQLATGRGATPRGGARDGDVLVM